jgi:ABC-type lipoprotein export system ATPase subunit
VRAGEVIALLGPSGSGKTTLLNIIGCILAPSSGRVVLDGEPVFDGKWLRATCDASGSTRSASSFRRTTCCPS